jgi:DNA polymerase I-like protein with 3'-5' exonuclease and polymerase domains
MFVDSQWHSLNIDDHTDYVIGDSVVLNRDNTLITFQTGYLIPYIKANKPFFRVPIIIDLECFDKQMSQEGKDSKKYKEWKAIRFLMHHKMVGPEFELKYANLKSLLELLGKLYLKLLEKDSAETKRFNSIESTINKIIYQRQYRGVGVDLTIAKQKCVELEKEIYLVKNILQLEYNIFNPESEAQQRAYLKSKNYNLVQSPKYTLKIWKGTDRVCGLIYDLIRNSEDLDSFIYMLSHWGGKHRTFPSYFGFGSITSRITMRQPSLQNLRKSNRSVIIPDIGTKFLYIDYSQFEAGILASLSRDENLIQLYNTDIYGDLAEKVLNDKNKRSEAKIIFYRFMYGDESLDKSAKDYFRRFNELTEFKVKISETLKSEGKIGTVKGNFRRSIDEESTWALSHMIQATASLIYKEAIIRTNKEVYSAKLIVPLHDGTLYQIDDYIYDKHKKAIENIYIEEFKKHCPLITPRVTSRELFD